MKFKYIKYKKFVLLFFSIFLLLGSFGVFARESKIDYGENLVIDSDLDGLTDLGEEQIFGTDKTNPDSDGDGLLDGAEVIGGFDPLDQNDRAASQTVKQATPWAWYLARTFGLVGFSLLYLDMLFALVMRIPFLAIVFRKIIIAKTHQWLSIYAFIFVLSHGVVLLFDQYLDFGWLEVFVPFSAERFQLPIAWGILVFYSMLILIVTSYARTVINQRIWRLVHWLNIFVFVGGVIHAISVGTDLKNSTVYWIFLIANGLLAGLFGLNLFFRIRNKMKRVRLDQETGKL